MKKELTRPPSLDGPSCAGAGQDRLAFPRNAKRTDITLYYQISPELWQAANTFAMKKSWPTRLFVLIGSLGLLVASVLSLVGQEKSFVVRAAYLFSIVGGSAALWYQLRGFFAFGKTREEISLAVREDGIFCSRAGGQLYPWSSLLEIRAIREKQRENDWLAILLKGALPSLLPTPFSTFAKRLSLGSWQLKAVLPVPFSAFADDAARQAFVEAVSAHLPRSGRESLISNESAPCDFLGAQR